MNVDVLKELTESESAVAIYFSTSNCGVCHALKPKIEQLFSTDFPRMRFIHVEIEKSPEVSGVYGVFTAPTLLVFFEGKEVLRKARNMGIQELREKIERPYNLMFA